jgi:DNA-binding NtrC family response regulator
MNPGMSILVAIDDETVAEWVAAFMREGGGSAVSVALSAEQALAAFEQHPVGVVFADLVPKCGMHSFELAVIVADRYPGIPVICAVDARSPPSGNSAGCTIISRPYRSSDIIDAINETAPECLAGGGASGEGQ